MEHLQQFIVNHWYLWLLLIVILSIIFVNELIAQKKRAKEVSPQETVRLMNEDKTVVIDLRDADSFRTGHIIHAIRATADDFMQSRMDKYKEKIIVLVCAKGLQSTALAAKLREQGFTQATVLAGGMNAWQTADLPLVKGK